MKNLSNNKWVRAAIPALLLHCSIGTVYCWSIFSQEIADYIGFSKSATEWAFSFAIFFLGMSAAFLGNIVEKDIHKSSLIAAICFASGMAGAGFFIWYGGSHPGSIVSLLGIYVCYGFIMGIGLGTGYLSPVKTLMLWFEDRKGLATGLAVAGFGAAKAIASPIMFYLNITCGLALISQEKMIIKCIGLVGAVGVLSSVTAIFNAGGRLGFSAWADTFKDRNTIYKIIFILSIVATGLVILTQGITNMGANTLFMILVLILLFVVNAGYGGGFSNVPTLLSDHYGMKNISAIHGITLSAWAFAGLTGNQMATFIVNHFGSEVELSHALADGTTEIIKVNPSGYQMVLYVTLVLYIVAAVICFTMVGKKSEKKN